MVTPIRSRLAFALCLALALTACTDSSAPPASTEPAATAAAEPTRPVKHYTIEEFVETTSVGGSSFSADESRVLFSSNRNGVWNVYTMPVAGGDWTAITTSTTDNTSSIGYFPTDDRILVTRDQSGNELNHLYVINTDGTERDITPGDKLKANFERFSHAGDAFYVSTNERDPRFFDLYKYDSKTYARELVFENKDGFDIGSISGDGKFVVLQKTRTTLDNNLYLQDLTSGKQVHLTPHTGDANYNAQSFDATNTALYYTTDEGSEFSKLRRYLLATSTHEDVRSDTWDIFDVSFSHNGKYRIDMTNVDGATRVEVLDTATGAPIKLPSMPAGEIRNVRVSRSESRMAFYVNGDRQPNDLYTLAFDQAEPTRLTNSLSPKIDAADLVDSKVVRFKARDGMEIPNILWKPHQATATNKAPALLMVHGGPGGQTTRAYSYVAQYLANHGYVVLGINNRGSSGYGKTFYAADDGKHGREPLWDCVDGKTYLQTLDYIDPDRIGIMGGSYGGYMTAAALAFQPDEFKVGVNIFGVTNWLRTLESIPPYWESFREALYKEVGNPATQRDFLIETSPLFHADKIKKPLMVLQGANDPRVIKPESDDIVAAVKKNGVPVEYIVFDDEGHGFTKKKNQIAGYGAMLKFLDTYLKGDGPVAADPAVAEPNAEAKTDSE